MATTGRAASWTMDTFEGNPFDPPSLHKYLYVAGDPVNRIDPSGHLLGLVGQALEFLSQAKEILKDPITSLERMAYGRKIHKQIGIDFEAKAADPYVDKWIKDTEGRGSRAKLIYDEAKRLSQEYVK